MIFRTPFRNGLPIEGHNDDSEDKEYMLKIYKLHLKRTDKKVTRR